ncbi:MAG: hypothetical protein ACOY71_05530 [Gemmatimonadota bacterium]
MLQLLALAIAIAAGLTGFVISRRFVRRRLRSVDAVRSPFAPLIAGVAGALIATPVTLLPLVTAGTAAVFGIGTGLGTATGVKDLRRLDG